MMIEELQLLAGEENPFRNCLVTFFSFAIFGFTALVPTIIAHANNLNTLTSGYIIATIIVAIVFLAVLGVAKSLVGGTVWYWSVLETIIIGAISAAIAYGIGLAF